MDDELSTLSAAGRVRVDGAGSVTGAMGLSLDETGHRLAIGDAQWFTWCAIDALGIIGALEATGTIQSDQPPQRAADRYRFRGWSSRRAATCPVWYSWPPTARAPRWSINGAPRSTSSSPRQLPKPGRGRPYRRVRSATPGHRASCRSLEGAACRVTNLSCR